MLPGNVQKLFLGRAEFHFVVKPSACSTPTGVRLMLKLLEQQQCSICHQCMKKNKRKICKMYKDKQRGRWQCVKLSFIRVCRILLLSEIQIHSFIEWWKPPVWANFDLSNTCLHSNIHSNMLRFKTLLKGTLAGRSQGWDQNHMVCIT